MVNKELMKVGRVTETNKEERLSPPGLRRKREGMAWLVKTQGGCGRRDSPRSYDQD